MKNKFKNSIGYIILAISVFISIFPFYFMFTSATNSNNEILKNPPSLAFGTNLMANFENLKGRVDIWRVTGNSLGLAIVYTLISILIFSMAGYAFAKFEFKGKNLAFSLIMLCMMLPPQVTHVPLFQMMMKIKWESTYQSVLLPALANAFGIFLMRQNATSFPDSLLEAARLDGMGELGIFFKIVMPNLKAAIAALGIYMFLSSWNELMWPLIILRENHMKTLPVALQFLDGIPNRKDYGMMMLAASISVLPIMMVYLLFQKQFIVGMMGGAIKE